MLPYLILFATYIPQIVLILGQKEGVHGIRSICLQRIFSAYVSRLRLVTEIDCLKLYVSCAIVQQVVIK